jgi:hypothetical protein
MTAPLPPLNKGVSPPLAPATEISALFAPEGIGTVYVPGCVNVIDFGLRTVIRKEHGVTPGISEEQVTWVITPTGNNDPEGGLHVTVPQSPVVVGAG